MAYTDVWDVTAPLDTQAANQGAADFRATKLDIMQRVASFGAGLAANRPTPETSSATADWTGVMYWATDTKKVYRWNGSSWDDISTDIPSGGSGITKATNFTLANITNPVTNAVYNVATLPATLAVGTVIKARGSALVNVTSGSGILSLSVVVSTGTYIGVEIPLVTDSQYYIIATELTMVVSTSTISLFVGTALRCLNSTGAGTVFSTTSGPGGIPMTLADTVSVEHYISSGYSGVFQGIFVTTEMY